MYLDQEVLSVPLLLDLDANCLGMKPAKAGYSAPDGVAGGITSSILIFNSGLTNTAFSRLAL